MVLTCGFAAEADKECGIEEEQETSSSVVTVENPAPAAEDTPLTMVAADEDANSRIQQEVRAPLIFHHSFIPVKRRLRCNGCWLCG